MTPEERNKYIADCCDGFKGQLLARADRIPRDWDCAEIQQWIMDTARDAWTVKMTPTRRHRWPAYGFAFLLTWGNRCVFKFLDHSFSRFLRRAFGMVKVVQVDAHCFACGRRDPRGKDMLTDWLSSGL